MSHEVIAPIIGHDDYFDFLVRRYVHPAPELVQVMAAKGSGSSVITYFQSGTSAALATSIAIAAEQSDVRVYHFSVGE